MTTERIGKFSILDEIASGAQGAVYRALDSESGRIVALKVLHGELSRNERYVERFRREAKLAASTDHPNIIQIYEVGQAKDVHFMAVEFLPESLSRLIESGPLPIERAAEYAAQISDGLSAAHSAGIVHRDIKPQNVLIGTDGEAKITDFGIARGEHMSTMTATGVMMGTPHYMSPEQASGTRADGRSDLYALGCVLYQMLSGNVPFAATTPLAVIRQHIDDDPPSIKDSRKEVPNALANVVKRALEKNPDDRFQSAAEMASAIRSAVPNIGAARSIDPDRPRTVIIDRGGSGDSPPGYSGDSASSTGDGSSISRIGRRLLLWAALLAVVGVTVGVGYVVWGFINPGDQADVIEKPGTSAPVTEAPKEPGSSVSPGDKPDTTDNETVSSMEPQGGFNPVVQKTDEGVGELILTLPAGERDCLIEEVGSDTYNDMLGGSATPESNQSLFNCMGTKSFAQLTVGGMVASSGINLSPATLICMDERSTEMQNVSSSTTKTAGLATKINNTIPTILCMSSSERLSVSLAAEEMFTLDIDGDQATGIDCIYDQISADGFSSLTAIIQKFELGGGGSWEGFGSLSPDFGETMSSCEMTVSDGRLVPTRMVSDPPSSDLDNSPRELSPPPNFRVSEFDGIVKVEWGQDPSLTAEERENIIFSVFRSSSLDDSFQPMNQSIATYHYDDSLVSPGDTFYYIVTARLDGYIDSKPSGPVSITLTTDLATDGEDDVPDWANAVGVPYDCPSSCEPVFGSIDFPGDIDYFYFNAEEGRQLQIKVVLESLNDSYLKLYGPGNANLIQENDDEANSAGSEIVFTVTENGEYGIEVLGFDQNSMGSYWVEIHSIEVIVDDILGRDTAPEITLEAVGVGVIDYSGDPDYFYFYAEGGANYRIQTVLGSLSDSYLSLYDADNELLAENDDHGSDLASLISWVAPESGLYFVEVLGTGSVLGDYRVELSFDDDIPDIENAFELGINTPDYSGRIDYSGDLDYFFFNAEGGSRYQIWTVLNSLPDSFLTLYESDGSTVIEENDDEPGGESPASRITWVAPETKIYILEVKGLYGSDTGSYVIELQPLGFEDDISNWDEAVELVGGSSVSGRIDYEGDIDYFSINVEPGVNYLFKTELDTLEDTTLTLYDQNRKTVIGENDDFEGQASSGIRHQFDSEGTFWLAVRAWNDSYTGTYSISSNSKPSIVEDDIPDWNSAVEVPVETNSFGTIDYGDDKDYFYFRADADSLITIRTHLQTLPDSVLTLYDSDRTTVILENDDDEDSAASSITWNVPRTDTYFVEVRGFDASHTGTYEVDWWYEETERQNDDNQDFDQAINVPVVQLSENAPEIFVKSEIEFFGDTDFFSFDLAQGEKYEVKVHLYTLNDSYMRLFGTDVNFIEENDDYQDGLGSGTEFVAPRDGRYFIAVEGFMDVAESDANLGSYGVTVVHLSGPGISSTSDIGPNLLMNPSFDDGDPASRVPDNWVWRRNTVTDAAFYWHHPAQRPGFGRTGESSVRITTTAGSATRPDAQPSIVSDRVKVQAGYTYEASVFVWSENGAYASLDLIFFDDDDTSIKGAGESYGEFSEDGAWIKMAVSGVAPSGAAFARVLLGQNVLATQGRQTSVVFDEAVLGENLESTDGMGTITSGVVSLAPGGGIMLGDSYLSYQGNLREQMGLVAPGPGVEIARVSPEGTGCNANRERNNSFWTPREGYRGPTSFQELSDLTDPGWDFRSGVGTDTYEVVFCTKRADAYWGGSGVSDLNTGLMLVRHENEYLIIDFLDTYSDGSLDVRYWRGEPGVTNFSTISDDEIEEVEIVIEKSVPSNIELFAGNQLWGAVREMVNLSGARVSSSNPNDNLTVSVDWGDDQEPQGATVVDDGQIVGGHEYKRSGTYWITLQAQNENGVSSPSSGTQVVIEPTRVDVDAPNFVDGFANESFELFAFAFSNNPRDPLAAKIDWGDGTGEQSVVLIRNTGEILGNHVYGAPGSYRALIRVQADSGSEGAAFVNIDIRERRADN